MKHVPLSFFLMLILAACSKYADKPVYKAPYTGEKPQIDARAGEAVWDKAPWAAIDQNWVGAEYTDEDFQGRYKACWDEDRLYLLVEITDDTLIDIHPDPLEAYWDDDCVEVFIDEDASGGNHQYNHSAFAYHVALDKNVADIGADSSAILLNDHAKAEHRRNGKQSTWELAFKIFDDTFDPDKANQPRSLKAGEVLGFAIAYCDNDTSETRENFIGSVPVKGDDKNKGWIDAGVFGRMKLLEN